jgi:DNA modification methylase
MILKEERIGGQRLILGDCIAVMSEISGTEAMITDPPYSSGGFQESGKSVGSIGTRSGASIAGDTLSTRGYLRLMKSVFRATRADEFFVFTDWRMWLNTFDAMEDGYIRVRNMLVWDKKQMGMGLPWRNQHELIAYGKRSPASNVTGAAGNVLQFPRSGNEHHPTEKPVGLIMELLKNSYAQTILDPFMGSGTTLVACQRMGRNGTGIELDPEYFAIACKRVDEASRQPDLLIDPPKPQPVQEGFDL